MLVVIVQDRHAGPGAAQVVVVGGGAGHADPADRRGSEIAHDRQAAGAGHNLALAHDREAAMRQPGRVRVDGVERGRVRLVQRQLG